MSDQDWSGRRILVTGGAGFLGSSLCHALAGRGARVTALDNFLPRGGANEANLERMPPGAILRVLHADLRDADLAAACEGVEFVFNLAAQGSHTLAQDDPATDLAINAGAQIRLIQAMRDHAPGAVIVHASTRQVYGRPHALPVAEDHPVNPPDANAVSKWAGERYWLLEHQLTARPVVVLRLTNCYGPRQHIRDAGQSFLGGWVGRVLSGRAFEVWGGEQLRDLLFVDDAVAALLAAVQPACHGRVLNVGGVAPATLHQVATRLTAAAGSFIVRDMPRCRAAIDIGSFVTDDRRFRAATGWAPQTPLGAGLDATLAWFRPRLPHYA